MPTFVQDPETHELIPKEEYHAHLAEKGRAAYIRDDLSPFVSPIDGSVISSRTHLREHNRKHSVTDPRDYGPNWFERKAKERAVEYAGTSKKAKAERVEAIQESMYRNGVR
tara:strand:+ start:1020 stop:1352 length:333 start_codon:yes stop_codon:yes gene_type:complete